MKILLSPDTERIITERINSGRYSSAEEVVREGLELLQKREEGMRQMSSQSSTDLATVFGAIATDVPETDWARLPVDLSKNLDHYVYGGRKTS